MGPIDLRLVMSLGLPNGSCSRRARPSHRVSRVVSVVSAETLMRLDSRSLAAELGR